MNDLSCGVTRDLLPLYVDGVVGDETMAAVSFHLEWCDDCKKLYDKMRRDLVIPPEQDESALLEKLRRKARRERAAWIAAGAALGLLVILGIVFGVRAHREAVRSGAFLRILQSKTFATEQTYEAGYASAWLEAIYPAGQESGAALYREPGKSRVMKQNTALVWPDAAHLQEGGLGSDPGGVLLHFDTPMTSVKAETETGLQIPCVMVGDNYFCRLDVSQISLDLIRKGAEFRRNFGLVTGVTSGYYHEEGRVYWLDAAPVTIRVTCTGEKYTYVYQFQVQFCCTYTLPVEDT